MAKHSSKKKRDDITSIQISKATKKLLEELGRKGETFEEIIIRLLKK